MAEQLALYGGIPVRDSLLPYGKQWISEEDVEAVAQILRGDFLTTGPAVEQFERSVASYVGVNYAVAFANGTAALHGAVFAAGITEGDEVITTPMTFAASANCVLYQKGCPVFADIAPLTGNIDPATIEDLITSKTRAIIPVDYTGRPVEIDKIRRIAEKYGLIIIEDAAHAFGASFKGVRVGTLSGMTMFSFHPVKHITTGEGGIIVTNSVEYYEKLRLFRSHGIIKEPCKLSKNEGPWYHEMQCLGYNYRMTDIQAALGISQLRKSDDFLMRRRQLVNQYREGLASLEGVFLPPQDVADVSSWHLFVIQLELEKIMVGRRDVFEALRAENIGVNVHYIPVYHHPYYTSLDYRPKCPQVERFYERIITLPLFPAMRDQDIRDVVRAMNKVLTYFLIRE
jgi:UDP-4-amino-4,6-dideoxy-N-acetyl-beta-L-altrosamine transaminase